MVMLSVQNIGTLTKLTALLFWGKTSAFMSQFAQFELSEYFLLLQALLYCSSLDFALNPVFMSLTSPETLLENRPRDGVPSEDLVTESMIELCVAHHQLSSYFCSSPSVAHTAGLLSSGWLHFCCCCFGGSPHGTGISKMLGSSAATTLSLLTYPGLSPWSPVLLHST